MAISQAPIQNQIVNERGFVPQVWALWFNKLKILLDNSRPFPLTKYTVLGAPLAADNEGSIIYVSDETGGKTLAFSDGTNWRRVQDRNVVS
jgi:hypothetical protein